MVLDIMDMAIDMDMVDIMDMGDIMDMLDTTTDLMDMDTHTGDRYQFKINCLNCQDLFCQLYLDCSH